MKKYIIAVILLAFIGVGCTEDFKEINTSKIKVVSLNDPGMLFLRMAFNGYTVSFQVATNLYHDLYAQYFSNKHQGFDSPNYAPHSSWIRSRWRNYYVNYSLPYLLEMKKMYEEDPYFSNAYYIGTIFMALLTHQMVDIWGDIPYSQAGTGLLSVPYDNAEDIYISLIDQLDLAHSSLVISESQFNLGDYDPVYAGDVGLWKKFAQSLRLRLAMRMVNYDAAYAETIATDAISKGVISDNSGNATRLCDADNVNWYTGNFHNLINSWGEFCMSKTMENYLKGESAVEDPRMSIWFSPNEDNEYVGQRNGLGTVTKDERHSKINTAFFTVKKYHEILEYSEVCFMKAEAALRGWISGSPEEFYEDGIRASMEFVGVASTDIDTYIGGLLNDPFGGTDNEAILKQIITQRWLAAFPNGPEGWALFRRTDYPDFQVIDHYGSTTVSTGKFIKRLLYVDSEHDLNTGQVPFSKEEDSQNTRIFWDTDDDTPSNFK